MRGALTAVAVVLLVSSAWAQDKGDKGAKTEAAPKGPKIRVEPTTFDFGKAVPNKTLEKEFSLRNFGNEDLVIENVSTTCGCTAALMDSKVIKPGATTPLRVSLQTREYSGKVERTILVRSNDPTTALLEIKVQVTVVPPAK
ncbi:MAG TPA: DUF1573 domain-containing protein [Vicinamibacteria bacterium]|jgi:hypothetical protein|nr:DUF1573 domain-containing protein [Vicinamibacteria bacterium]